VDLNLYSRSARRSLTAWDAVVPEVPQPPDIRDPLAYRRPDSSCATVDVIIPVYGSRALALRAIDSVLGATTREGFELVVVDDASPDLLLRAELQALAEAGLITLVENERNVGFVRAANRGFMLHPHRDVFLLNSDTRVFGDWLDRRLRLAWRRHLVRRREGDARGGSAGDP
jgi:glycosyltransferase involved in cell wall biosynthesis